MQKIRPLRVGPGAKEIRAVGEHARRDWQVPEGLVIGVADGREVRDGIWRMIEPVLELSGL